MTSSQFDPFASVGPAFASPVSTPNVMANSSSGENAPPSPSPKPTIMNNNNTMVPVQGANSNQWSSHVAPTGGMPGTGMMQQQFGYGIQNNGQQIQQQPTIQGTMAQYNNPFNASMPSQPSSNMPLGVSGYDMSSGSNYQPQQFMSPGQQNPQQQQNFMSPNMSTPSGVGGALNVTPNSFAGQSMQMVAPVPSPAIAQQPAQQQSLVPHQQPYDPFGTQSNAPPPVPSDPFGSSYGVSGQQNFSSPNPPVAASNPFDMPAPAPVPVATHPNVASSNEQASAAPAEPVDEDFFGEFSNTFDKSQQDINESPSRNSLSHPPSVLEPSNDDEVSQFSRSVASVISNRPPISGKSAFDDPKFAPKPPKPHGLENSQSLAQKAHGCSPLPNWDLVTHSGYILSRISFRTILIKKWKQVFWISYGTSKVLFFRSKADFEDWVSNPYLTMTEREFLVKLAVDFVQDSYKPGVNGYQVTPQKLKSYNTEML